MIELNHVALPRLLENRKNHPNDKGMPENPRKAWDSFSTKGKREIHDKLIVLQNDLCVYCENKLDEYGFHIEHILSKTENPELTFEYTNLSLSCIENESLFNQNTDDNPVSCAHAPLKRRNRSDENLFIKPTEKECHSLFSYQITGEIVSNINNSEGDKKRVEHTKF